MRRVPMEVMGSAAEPAGLLPAAAGRAVAACRFGAGAELSVGCGVRSGVGVAAAVSM
ncbi:MAG: hypothetical protein OXC31_01470 [Spirochaetaceae bacterium]|nr:hypothetical protein [Spirochaetaceae bacterium]